MKRRIVSIITALALCLSLWPGTALAAGGTPLELDLSNQTSAVEDISGGYKWTDVQIDSTGTSKITSGTLTLAAGFNAERVILPDAAVTIVTTGDSTIGTLTTAKHEQGASATIQLAFSGRGKLEITKRIELSGGDYNTLTVAEDAIVTASKGISIGSGSEVILTVNGTLTAEGYYDDGYKANVPAISAGKVTVGDTGVLEVSGGAGVMLNGNASDLDDFTNMFTVTENGRFTADCTEYNVCIMSNTGALPEGTNAGGAIALSADYLPADCEAGITTDSSNNKQINLVRKSTGQVYTGPLTIHKWHDWSTEWKKDKDTHWHPCKFDGCDKKDGEAAHTFGTNDVCTICGAKLEVNLTDTDLVYDGKPKTPGVTITITAGTTTIPLTENIDYTVSCADNINAGTGTVTVTDINNSWTVTKPFTIEPAELTLTAPTASDIAYGQKLSNSTLAGGAAKDPQNNDVPGTWSWFASDTQPTVSGSFPVVFTPDDAKNYKTPETNPTTNVTVNPATPQITLNVVPSEQVVGGEVAVSCTVANPYDSDFMDDLPSVTLAYTIGSTTETIEADGKFTIPADTVVNTSITVTASTAEVTDKYTANTKTATVTVTDKTPVTITGVKAQDGTYNGNPHTGYTGTPRAEPYTGGFTVTYAGRESTRYSSTTAPTNAGDYTVTISLADTGTYTGSLSLDFIIAPATITITADNKQATVGSAKPALTYTVAGLAAGDTLATVPTLTCDADMSRAGSYSITVTGAAVPSGGNYDLAITYIPGTLTVTEPYVPPVHRHNWSTAWAFDSTRHWHRCLNGCSERNNVAEHVYDDEWDTGCNICGYERGVEPPPHVHDWDSAWSKDDTHHWHECLADGCTITGDSGKDGYEEHVYDDEWDTDCNVCGYVREVTPPEPGHTHVWSEEWSHDEARHWHECTAPGCDITDNSQKDGYEEHVYDDEQDTDCNICGYVREVTPPEPEHTHVWAEEWSHDEARHWHECTAPGCDITDNSQKDGYGAHVPGAWTTGDPATSTTAGRRYRACAVCGRILETESIPAAGGSSGGGSSVRTYAITVEKPEHGKVTSNRTRAASGTTVTLTVTPDTGYVLLDLTVTDSQGNPVTLTDRNTFTMPSRAVTVKASFAPLPDDSRPCDGGADCPSRAYADLDTGAWYHEAVDYAIQKGLLTGYGDGTFHPSGILSRAQLAQILYNMEGKPGINGGGGFMDVAPDSWYADAVMWAAAQGIAGGYGNGKFGPNDHITREQLAVMLWRYSKGPVAAGKELHFSDANRASSWALDALRWAAENGILNGKGNGMLDPRGLTSRAETAQMLKNFAENPEENK